MIDFTSALYLGMKHKGLCLMPDEQMTTGKPSVLETPCESQKAAKEMAMLQGCEDGVLATSTIHIFYDLFKMFTADSFAIFADSGTYPIVMWGIDRAAANGVPVRFFPHYNTEGLSREIKRNILYTQRPIIATDGFCPACGRTAPIRYYLDIAKYYGGLLVIDDTQSTGILGYSADTYTSYGLDGGGILRWSSILNDPDIILVSSLAKGFGVPVAVLSGSYKIVQFFKSHSETSVHCSPPSMASVRALKNALSINKYCGNNLRSRLLNLVQYFRTGLRTIGYCSRGGLFPVQILQLPSFLNVALIHENLLRQGVKTILHKGKNSKGIFISLIITAAHTFREIDNTLNILGNVMQDLALVRNCSSQGYRCYP